VVTVGKNLRKKTKDNEPRPKKNLERVQKKRKKSRGWNKKMEGIRGRGRCGTPGCLTLKVL